MANEEAALTFVARLRDQATREAARVKRMLKAQSGKVGDFSTTFRAKDEASSVIKTLDKRVDSFAAHAASAGRTAARWLGRGLVAGVLAVGTAFGLGAHEAAAYQAIGAKTDAIIRSTGGSAGVTTDHLKSLAASVEGLAAVDENLVLAGENVLLTFTNVRNTVGRGNDVFDQATRLGADMAAVLGQDVTSSAMQLGKALNDPMQGLLALRRVGVAFTDEQKKQIATMATHGNVLGAQKVILAELTREFGGAAQAGGSGFTGAMFRARDAASDMLRNLVTPALPLFSKGMEYLSGVVSKHVAPALEHVAGLAPALVAAFRNDDMVSAGQVLANMFGLSGARAEQLTNALYTAQGILADVAQVIRGSVVPAFNDAKNLLPAFLSPLALARDLLGAMAAHGTATKLVLEGVLVTMALYRAATFGIAAATAVATTARTAYAIIVGRETVAEEANVAGKVIGKTVTFAIAAATKAYAAAQWLLNVAMTANPIGLVVAALVLLVAGLIIAWKRSDTFRKIVSGAFASVKRVVGDMVGVTIKAFRMWASVWLTVADGIISTAAHAFGWVPGIGGKLKKANAEFDSFKSRMLGTLDSAADAAFGYGEAVGSQAAAGVAYGLAREQERAFANAGNLGPQAAQAAAAKRAAGRGAVSREDMPVAPPKPKPAPKPAPGAGAPVAFHEPKPPAAAKAPKIAVLPGEGKAAVAGLVGAIRAGEKPVRAAVTKLRSVIDKAFRAREVNAAQRNAALTLLNRETSAVVKAAAARETAARKLAAAEKALAAVRKARADTVAAVRSAVAAFGDLTKITAAEGRTLDASTIVDGLRKRVAAIRAYAANIDVLKAAHLNAASLKQIIDAGVEGGAETAAALAAGGSAAVSQVNDLQRQVDAAGKGLGKTAGDALYAAGEAAAAGLVKGLKAKQAEIDKAAAHLGLVLGAALRKALGIHSPSRVTGGAGVNAGLSLAGGLRSTSGAVAAEAAALARRVELAATPRIDALAALADAQARTSLRAVRTEHVLTLRHEVAFRGPAPAGLSAEDVADVIARDPRSAKRIENALRPLRLHDSSRDVTATR